LELAGVALADSTRALRVLETSHPPTVYLPPDDVRGDLLAASGARLTWCEFKGAARYLDAVVDGHRVHAAAWTYRDPTPAYEALRDHVALYPSLVDVAWMGDERVQAQASDFYGCWITADLVGPSRTTGNAWLVGRLQQTLLERATAADLPRRSCGPARTPVSATSHPHCARSAEATSASGRVPQVL
jgi:uncharacterized protein (DUF427 family)